MSLVDFYISNPGHHVAMIRPVLALLKQQPEYRCRLISLCHFRGFASPTAQFPLADDFISIPRHQLRQSPAAGKQMGRGYARKLRRLVRVMSWQMLLQRPLRQAFSAHPNLVVLPNDAAFPYDRIVSMLYGRQIPFLLLQEGIRFPLPVEKEAVAYGAGGAAAIAAWGESSTAYFRAQGAPPQTVHCTGSPRFDAVAQTDWGPEAQALKAKYGFGQMNLLFLSNPIDDQGFVATADEKLALVHRFLTGIAPLFTNPGFHLIMKLHGREAVADFQAVASAFPFAAQITVLGSAPLYPLFTLAQAAIVWASTVGLEALLFDLPLGVLEIPGVGFVHDYVEQKAALGLRWDQPLEAQVQSLLDGHGRCPDAVNAYLQSTLAARGQAASRVAQLIQEITPS